MAGQRKWGKNGYLKDFKGNRQEGYVYTGIFWQAPEPERRRLLSRLWALQGVGLVSAILPGLFTVKALQNTFYAIIPYVLWLIGSIYLTYLLGKMTFAGNPMRGYVYERSVEKFGPAAALVAVGALLTVLGVLLFLGRGGSGQGAGVCLLCGIVQGMSFFLIKKCRVAGVWKSISSGPPEAGEK